MPPAVNAAMTGSARDLTEALITLERFYGPLTIENVHVDE
jgi:hypothetical protein